MPSSSLFISSWRRCSCFVPKACSSARRQGESDEKRHAPRSHALAGCWSRAVRPAAANLDAFACNDCRIQCPDRVGHCNTGSNGGGLIGSRALLCRGGLWGCAERESLRDEG